MNSDDLRLLACPRCHGALQFHGAPARDSIEEGILECAPCAEQWQVAGGLPRLVDETAVGGLDRLMRLVYDGLGRFHDPAVEWLLPLLQWESIDRNNYIRRLELDELAKVRHRPVRILEIGIGGGANIPLVEAALPAALEYELWGADLSEGMLTQCRRRLQAAPSIAPVRLCIADAHALPFADATFDRVFHVGGLNAYQDPRRGLAEMARVARPGTPIIVVDEQLDPHREHGLYPRLVFGLMTLFDPLGKSPRALLPPEAIDVIDEQASRFYYCLTFKMPAPEEGISPIVGESSASGD